MKDYTFWASIRRILTKDSLNFTGVSTRQEYWYYLAFQALINIFLFFIIIILSLISLFLLENQFNIFVIAFISLLLLIICLLCIALYVYILISFISLSVRRIRDFGIHSPILILLIMLLMIPFSFILVVFIGIFPSQYFNKRIKY